ncbi:MAG: hypothetical protein KDC26_04690 [Armatimonadetes bacterium]|nr:hypothetical protein [Armatimonadota bacterium]
MINLNPVDGFSSALMALRDAESRAAGAAEKLASEGVDAMPEVDMELRLSKIQHKSNIAVIRSLDDMKGNLIDMLA